MVEQRRDKRAEYLRKWFEKAKQGTDVFDRFICGWLALVIAAKIHWTNSGSSTRDTTDREIVREYLRHNAIAVDKAVQAHQDKARSLAERKATNGGMIIDGSQQLREHCCNFRRRVLGQSGCSDTEFAVAMAEILNRVRNNLFHGSKVYDDAEDRELLESLTPLLLGIVATCETRRG